MTQTSWWTVRRITQLGHALRERKLHQAQNVILILDSNPDFRINPDTDVCRIAPKM